MYISYIQQLGHSSLSIMAFTYRQTDHRRKAYEKAGFDKYSIPVHKADIPSRNVIIYIISIYLWFVNINPFRVPLNVFDGLKYLIELISPAFWLRLRQNLWRSVGGIAVLSLKIWRCKYHRRILSFPLRNDLTKLKKNLSETAHPAASYGVFI